MRRKRRNRKVESCLDHKTINSFNSKWAKQQFRKFRK